MDVYLLDNKLRRTAVIDQYVSFIWTERWPIKGDFELVVHSTPETRSLLTVGRMFAILSSKYVMMIDTIENKKDSEGRALLTLTGPSLEFILEDRVAKKTLSNLTAEPTWSLWGTPGYIIRTMFEEVCLNGKLSLADKIPFLKSGTISPPGNILEPDVVMVLEFEVGTLYDAIKQMCEMYSLGARLIRNDDKSELYFEVYSGDNRTTAQETLAPVIFSQELDTLSDVTELTSMAQYKNVAYVLSENGSETVYASSANPSTSGFERRVLYVDASDVDLPAGAELTAVLQQKGLDALAEHRALAAFDGEIPQNSQYTYGVHYNLGDLVEMRNADGLTNQMRVTEQIFVSDSEGDRSYPTLTIDLFITPGAWYAWDQNQVWEEAQGTWDEA